MIVEPYGPVYSEGQVSLDVESLRELGADLTDCVFGVQVNDDGRVWVCVNACTFLRFKPRPPRDLPAND